VLRFAFGVTLAFVVAELMEWTPPYLSAVLTCVVLANIPMRPPIKVAFGFCLVIGGAAFFGLLLSYAFRGVPHILFGLSTLIVFHALYALAAESWRIDAYIAMQREDAKGGALVVSNSSSAPRIALYQPTALPPGRYRVRASGSAETGSKITAAFACSGRFPLMEQPEGDLLGEGQVVTAGDCRDQQLGLWLSGNNSTVHLRSIELTAAK